MLRWIFRHEIKVPNEEDVFPTPPEKLDKRYHASIIPNKYKKDSTSLSIAAREALKNGLAAYEKDLF